MLKKPSLLPWALSIVLSAMQAAQGFGPQAGRGQASRHRYVSQNTLVPDAGGGGPAATSELTIDELVGKVFLAYGGKYALAQVNGPLIEYGTRREFESDGQATVQAYRHTRKAGKFRVDLSAPPGVKPGGQTLTPASSVTAYDGNGLWKSIDNEVYAVPQAQAQAILEEEEQRPSILCKFGQPGYQFVQKGRTTYRQMPVYAVEIAAKGKAPLTVFIDQHNYLVVAMTSRGIDQQTGLPANLAIDFSQYRPYGGTLVAFNQLRLVNDRPVFETQLESLAFAPRIDDTGFNRPGERETIRLSRAETIPIQLSHGELIIKVRLNGGEPLDFLFDTGASDTIVDRRTAAENYLDKQGSASLSAASSAVSTQSSIIGKLELGSTALTDVPAMILDLAPQSRQLGRRIAGIIGHNVISQFATTIDYGKSAVVLADASTYNPPAGSAIVPFTDRRGPVVKAVLNGRDEEAFLVDTGAAFNHLPPQVARRFVKEDPQHLTEGTGLDGRPVRLGTVAVDSVSLGALRVKDVSFTYAAQQEAPRELGGFFQTTNLGILGNPFWQNFTVTLDYKYHRLVLRAHQPAKFRQDVKQLVTTGDAKLIMHRDYRAADVAYRSGLASAQAISDPRGEARFLGRLGNLYRVMSRDLNRPELAKSSYDYFTKAQAAARKAGDREVEGRILADWSLLYSDKGQAREARTMIEAALQLAPQDAQVNVDYAVHLYRGKQYAEMQKFIDKALVLDPANWQALWYQVRLSETFFDTPRVVATLREILRIYPWSKLAREKLSSVSPQMVPQPPAQAPKPVKPPAQH